MMIQIIFLISAWTLVSLFLINIGKVSTEGINHLKRLHQVPCDRCIYFTGDYRLKCTVHPITAMSEDAIHCRDFTPNVYGCKNCSLNCSKFTNQHLSKQ